MGVLIFLLMGTIGKLDGPIDGPDKCDVKDTVYFSLPKEIKTKESILCIPENKDWRILKDFDGSPIIAFNPKKEGTYSFVIAIADKPYFKSITVGNVSPDIIPTNNYQQAFEKDGRNQANLKELIDVYQVVANAKFKTNGEAFEYLVKFAKPIALPNLKKETGAYMDSNLNLNAEDPVDSTQLNKVFGQLITILKGLK
jgi:hypothetical protein